MNDSSHTYKVKANEFEFTYTQEELQNADLVRISENEFNILNGHRSVNAKILEADTAAKKLTVEVEGETFVIEIKDELDLMLEKMGLNAVSGKHIKEIKAPMPGLVLEIAVKEGQEVAEGEKLLVLEAMKMENSITNPASAVVKKIRIKAGQVVEKGQVLIEFE